MRVIEQQTTPTLLFLLVASTDHITPLTGLGSTPVVTLSKNGGTFTAATNAVSEVGNGWYKIILTAAETYSAGVTGWDLALHATGTGADPTDRLVVVELATVSNIDTEVDAIQTALAAVPTTPLLAADTRLNNLDATVSSRLPTSGYTAPPATVTLASSQPDYAPAKAGDAMNLTIAYNGAKTAAPTTGMIDSALTAMHGSGSWVSTSAPTTAQIDTALTATHGSGSWVSDSANIAGAVWDTAATAHATNGSFGYYLKRIFGWMFWRKDVTTSQIKTYDTDNTTVLGTQTLTGDGTTTSSVSKSV